MLLASIGIAVAQRNALWFLVIGTGLPSQLGHGEFGVRRSFDFVKVCIVVGQNDAL
jgi:hypothetical protein